MFSGLSIPQQKKIILFILSISFIYLLVAVFSLVIIQKDREPQNATHQLQDTSSDLTQTNEKEPVRVYTGIYLDSIQNVSIKDSTWSAIFYVWFRWKSEKSLDIGKNFHLVDAEVEEKELQESFITPDGIHYECYKVNAKIIKFFNTKLLPLEGHTLNITIEDAILEIGKLVYVPDSSTNISPGLEVPGFEIRSFTQSTDAYTYRTTYGDPLLREGDYTTYSQYNFSINIKRHGFGFYLKLFIGMFAGVILTLGSFFIRPTEAGPRYGIPSAAYFGVVGNTYMINGIMPPSGGFGFTDLMTGIGLLTITICVGATLLSGYLFIRQKEEEFSKAIDTVAWSTIGVWYILINTLLPILAFF